MPTLKLFTVIELEALLVPQVAETPIARSMVVSKLDTVRRAWVMGMGNRDMAVREVPCMRYPCPSRVPAVPVRLHIPSQYRIQGNAAEPDGVVITDDRAMSPVIVRVAVPNQNPQVRVGVPVVEYSPLALREIWEPRNRVRAGMTGTGSGSTLFLVVKVLNALPDASWYGPIGAV